MITFLEERIILIHIKICRNGDERMSKSAENVALLYLMNQDTKSLSLEELYKLYVDTVKQAKECAEKCNNEKGDTFSFA